MAGFGTQLGFPESRAAVAFGAPTRIRAAWTLAVLFLANLLNAGDRALLGVVTEPVKRDLNLSDVQMSLLSGLLFVSFNMVAGIFIAHRVDRGSRKQILAVGVTVWSLATALTGLAENFASLAACRVMVGVGEATAFPVALSMIGDLFRPAGRPRAVAFYQAGGILGFVSGSILAGVLASAYGWRTMFATCGSFGLLAVILLLLTIPEPARGHEGRDEEALSSSPGVFAVVRTILATRGFAYLALAYGVGSMSMAVVTAWGPAFLQRSHDVGLAALGAVIGPAVAIGGVGGIVASGLCASWVVRRLGQEKAALLIPIAALPLAAPAVALYLHAPTLGGAMAAAAVMNFLISCATPACVAVALGLAAPNTRGVASTLMLISHGLVGGALGPFLVGVLSDAFTAELGGEALRYAMGVMIAAPLAATLLLLLSYRDLGRSPSRG